MTLLTKLEKLNCEIFHNGSSFLIVRDVVPPVARTVLISKTDISFKNMDWDDLQKFIEKRGFVRSSDE